MSGVFIRQSRESDVKAIHELVQNLPPLTVHTPYTYWNLFRNFGNACFVAVNSRQPVGLITSHPSTKFPGEWFVWQLGVAPEHRGTGLAGELQSRVIEVAQEAGALAIVTSIEADNPQSFRSFSKLAVRLGTSMNETDRFCLEPDNPRAVPEVLYRIPLPQ